MNRHQAKKCCRLLFVIDQLSGGTGRVMVDLARGLDHTRFSPRLAVVHETSALLNQWPSDLPVHALSRPGESWRLGRFLAFRRLATLVKEQRIDLVVSALEVSNIYSALLKKRRPDLNVVLSYHTNLTGYRRQTHERYSFFGLPMEWYVRRMYGWADAVVSPSRGAAEDLAKTFGVPRDKSRWIPNPVDIGAIRKRSREPASFPWKKDPHPVICAAGTHRWIDTKGFDLLVRSLAEIPRGERPRLVLVGSGPQEDRVKELARSLKVSDAIWFAGLQSNPWKFMARSDLFVLSSRFETFALVLVEAMASGTPVLAADCEFGPREIIEHGKNGWLVPPENSHAMAEAIRMLCPQRALLRRLARAGRRSANTFDLSHRVLQYETLFEEISG